MRYDGLPSCPSFACDHGPFWPAKQEPCTARRRFPHEDPTVCAKLGCAQGLDHPMTQVTQNMLKESVDVLNVRRHLAVFDPAESSRPSREHLLLHKLLKMQTMILQALQQVCSILSHDQADSLYSSNRPFGRAVSPRILWTPILEEFH